MRPARDPLGTGYAPCQTASVDLGRAGNASARSQSQRRILDSVHLPRFLKQRRTRLWLVPAGIAGAAALAATGAFDAATSSGSLPATTPAALVADIRGSAVSGFSGTVVSRLSLGLPEVVSLGAAGGPGALASLLAGSHTLQVWYGGPDEQRVALLGSTEETDVFRDGSDMWQWSSADQVAVHASVPTADGPTVAARPSVASITPTVLAQAALAALGADTDVDVESGRTVADRSAYELVLTPRGDVTKVGAVHISVDGTTKIPLGVQIFARGAGVPAVDVAFTSIRFGRQAARNFDFTPPPNATVRDTGAGSDATAGRTTRTGSGWTTVVGLRPGRAAIERMAAPLLKALPRVSGSWGKGRLFDSSLLSVLVTDDGRVYVGAVAPSALYSAARN